MHKIVNGEQVPLSEQEILEFNARAASHQEEIIQYNNNKYKNDRASEYPSIGDQLDALWHAMDAGEIPVASNFYNSIKAVKGKYPKPE